MAGDVYVNGRRVGANVTIRPGDRILTGSDSSLIFVLGRDAYEVRQMTSLALDSDKESALITGLRIVSGALLAAFAPGRRTIRTGLVTAGIPGTAVYIETNPVPSCFCTCYGVVDLDAAADGSRRTINTRNHAAHYAYARGSREGALLEAPFINHTNAELAILEKLAGRPPVLSVS